MRGRKTNHETLDKDRPEFLSVIDIFGPLLFSACDLPDAFVDGKAEAYKILCRVFCRYHIRALPLFLLSHFYSIIQQGLFSRDGKNAVQNEILRHSSNIFNLALPGANTLIPYYLLEVRRVLTGEGRPNDVKERATIILGSLICLSSHFHDVEIPIGGDKSKASSKENSNIHDFLRIAGASTGRSTPTHTMAAIVAPLPLSNLLSEVLSIMTDALKVEHLEPSIQVRLIWGICVAVVEIVHSQPTQTLVTSGLVLMLLKHLSGQPRIVIRAAIHAITCLSYVADKIRLVDPAIISAIVESVSSNILREVGEFRANKSYPIDEMLVSDQLYCLLEWVLVFGDVLCNEIKLISKVCESLQLALTAVVKSEFTPRVANVKRRSMRAFGNLDETLQEIYAILVNADPTSIILPQIRDSAENVILHLLHFLHNAPGKEGIDVLTSLISHTDDIPEGMESKALHFVQNESVLYTLVEVPRKDNPERRFARIIVRDSIGKYAWDTDILFDYDMTEVCPPTPFPFVDSDGNPMGDFSPHGRADVHPPPSSSVDPTLIPLASNSYSEKTDQLNQLLEYLSSTYSDCLPENGQKLNLPADCQEAQKARIDYTETALVAQIEEDTAAMRRMQETVPPSHVWQMSLPPIPTPQGSTHHCRLLLSHLGFLTDENSGNLVLLSGENEKILRSLNQLDLTNGREMIKVGLIYLREGQEDQIDVLRNDSSCRTELFYEFVRSVGWPIDVQTHRAYLGGLDPKLTTGVTAPYYATSTCEMIFHDLTSMPTTEDPQQIHKKRHVGNDNVHVIWTEHVRDYNPKTIVSEFNDAHIVIYPLPNGLFKIHIYQKENVELFGPLMHGMVISKQLLPGLIRSTCLMANKYVRYTHEGYVTPYANRKRVLNQIIERHKDDTAFRDLIGSIL